MLDGLGIDLVELSGGSYEAPAMQGEARDGRTLAREAYFVEFARDIRAAARMPVMVTGGIRRRPVAEQVLASGWTWSASARRWPSSRTCRATGAPAGLGAAVAADNLEEQTPGLAGEHGRGEVPAAQAEPGQGDQPTGVAAVRVARAAGARSCRPAVTGGSCVRAPKPEHRQRLRRRCGRVRPACPAGRTRRRGRRAPASCG